MALKPVVLALSRSGEDTAHRVAEALGAQVHGREGRVERADTFFPNALDHARDLFAAGTPVIGVCASGILIRGVAPLLSDKRAGTQIKSCMKKLGKLVMRRDTNTHTKTNLACRASRVWLSHELCLNLEELLHWESICHASAQCCASNI